MLTKVRTAAVAQDNGDELLGWLLVAILDAAKRPMTADELFAELAHSLTVPSDPNHPERGH